MLKIIIKAAILVCIILSIYFIVNPSACSNLINGRVVNSTEDASVALPPDQPHHEMFTPAGDQPAGDWQPLENEDAQPQAQDQAAQAPVVSSSRSVNKPSRRSPGSADFQPAPETAAQRAPGAQPTQPAPGDASFAGFMDTNTLQDDAVKQTAQTSAYTQAQVDYAIASRYVELENEYIKQKKDMKKAAQEISYIVMDDFELTPGEWEAFLQRATVDNLFDKVRQAKAANN